MTVKELYESFGGNYNAAIQLLMNDEFIKRMLTKFVQSNSFVINKENTLVLLE